MYMYICNYGIVVSSIAIDCPWRMWNFQLSCKKGCSLSHLSTCMDNRDPSNVNYMYVSCIGIQDSFHWLLHISGASPRIWTCDTPSPQVSWVGFGLKTTYISPWWTVHHPTYPSYLPKRMMGTVIAEWRYWKREQVLQLYHSKWCYEIHYSHVTNL